MANEINKYEKSPRGQSPFSKLMAYLKPERSRIITATIFSIFGVLCLLAGPLVLKEIGTILVQATAQPPVPIDFEYLWLCAGVAIGVFFLNGLSSFLCSYLVAGACATGCARLRNDMIKKINSLPLNYFDTRNIGDVLSYVSNDVDIISTTLNQSFSSLISSVITILGVLIILFILDWRIALACLVILPIVIYILLKVGSRGEKFYKDRSDLTGIVSSEAEESFTGFNIIRVFKATEARRNSFAKHNFVLEKAMAKADFYSGVTTPLMTFFGNVIFSIIALIGAMIVSGLTGDKSAMIATVVAAVSYADQLLSPLTQVATTFATLQQTFASARRIFDFLEQENEPDESSKTGTIDNIQGNIKFDHVRFGYTKDRVIVHDFCEEGKAGQKIAIVGPTGAGKTTMVNLLMRFYELNSGKITIEGVDTKSLNRSYVRGLFGMVLQDTWLFEGTIMENLKYSRPSATDEEVYEACKATHCDSFIRQQPNGYNHILNEDCGLSAGQKQLLTIARAMIQNAPMLILDEATSSVDTRTEALIQDAMDQLMKGRTSFVIAHRLSTIKNSDLIIVMKDGDVIETGNHDELMKVDGFYAALYNSQFTGKGPQFS